MIKITYKETVYNINPKFITYWEEYNGKSYFAIWISMSCGNTIKFSFNKIDEEYYNIIKILNSL